MTITVADQTAQMCNMHMLKTWCNSVHVCYAPVICIHRPLGPGIRRAFQFSIFKAPLKALHSRAKLVVKSLLKAPALPGTDNNDEQQMT